MSAPTPLLTNPSVSASLALPQGLDTWPLFTEAWVTGFQTPANADDEHTLLRLLEIGFLPGEPVRLMACGPTGRDPLAVRVGQSTFALRRHEAALVKVTAQQAVT